VPWVVLIMGGYFVVFGSDATATNNPEIHAAEIKTLRYGFARIMTADEIIARLNACVPIAEPKNPTER
jgi:hypothetical protein